jgi:hypothetical protein
VLVEPDAGLRVTQKAYQRLAAGRPWRVAEIATIESQQVERIQEGLARTLAAEHRAHAVEVGSAIGPQITPSPSIITEAAGGACRAAATAGNCLLQSRPPREITRASVAVAHGHEPETVMFLFYTPIAGRSARDG